MCVCVCACLACFGGPIRCGRSHLPQRMGRYPRSGRGAGSGKVRREPVCSRPVSGSDGVNGTAGWCRCAVGRAQTRRQQGAPRPAPRPVQVARSQLMEASCSTAGGCMRPSTNAGHEGSAYLQIMSRTTASPQGDGHEDRHAGCWAAPRPHTLVGWETRGSGQQTCTGVVERKSHIPAQNGLIVSHVFCKHTEACGAGTHTHTHTHTPAGKPADEPCSWYSSKGST